MPQITLSESEGQMLEIVRERAELRRAEVRRIEAQINDLEERATELAMAADREAEALYGILGTAHGVEIEAPIRAKQSEDGSWVLDLPEPVLAE